MRITQSTLLVVFVAAAGALSAQIPAQNTQAINQEILLLKQSSDLVAREVGFTGTGEVMFTLQNRGDVPINPAVKGRGASDGPKIQVDVYVGGTLVQTVYQPSLAGKGSRAFTITSTVAPPKCGQSRDLKVVVDPKNVIAELKEDNNTTALSAPRPCPDLAVYSIERNYSGLLKETYTPEVTIINKGNWPSPPTQVWGTALSSAPGITGWPELGPTHNIPGLAPGQKTSFKIGGSVLSVDNSWVRILLDRYFKIEELDEGNNLLDKKI